MKSSIQPTTIDNLGGQIITIGNSSLHIISDFGCTITKLVLNGQEVLETNSDDKSLRAHTLARSMFLLPFPNRIRDGKYTFEGKTHKLTINEKARTNAIHGLVKDKKFSLINSEKSETSVSATFECTISKKDFKGYPFDLLLHLTFTLEEKKCTIEVAAKNIGERSLPYGVGWHPYLTQHKKIDQCEFMVPSNEILDVSPRLIPTGKQKKVDEVSGTLNDRKFDTCFVNLTSYETRLDNIVVFQDSSMKYLQVYTPEERMSIAVEPMSCAPDAFNNTMGLLTIKLGDTVTHSFGVRVE